MTLMVVLLELEIDTTIINLSQFGISKVSGEPYSI